MCGTLDKASALQCQAMLQNHNAAELEEAPVLTFAWIVGYEGQSVICDCELKHARQFSIRAMNRIELRLRDSERIRCEPSIREVGDLYTPVGHCRHQSANHEVLGEIPSLDDLLAAL